ncbi:MAG: alpha/beta fold hydrolase [Candidatus Staskawiczbacteria bacterium]|nr:alpha/beta fold hydrolase [Candidatus Staskawiczbacteria bacterium]
MKGVEEIFIDKGSKVGVLMIHGFSSTPRQFNELSSYLSERGFNILAPVIDGHGTSPANLLKTSPSDWTDSVKRAYFKLKEVSEKIFVIGNSFGSNLAFWLAKELNNEPEGIVALGTPIFLKYHNFIKFRLFTYGRFRKYYQKPLRLYKTDYTDMFDEISYPALPVKSLNHFIRFLERETTPNLFRVKSPVLIAASKADPVINPKSAEYIFEKIGSAKKEIFWFASDQHDITGMGCEGLFAKIYEFLKEDFKSLNLK